MNAQGHGVLGVLMVAACGGCAANARVELAAADALDALAGEFSAALGEYQADLERADDAREAEVVDAFLARARRDHADEAAMQRHTAEFAQALARVREDRETSWQRYSAALDNVGVTQEVARDLRGFALAGLALDQQARDYLRSVLDGHQNAERADVTGEGNGGQVHGSRKRIGSAAGQAGESGAGRGLGR